MFPLAIVNDAPVGLIRYPGVWMYIEMLDVGDIFIQVSGGDEASW